VVVVTDSSDADWWQGYNEGEEDKEGYFPASFVEMLSAASSSSPALASASASPASASASASALASSSALALSPSLASAVASSVAAALDFNIDAGREPTLDAGFASSVGPSGTVADGSLSMSPGTAARELAAAEAEMAAVEAELAALAADDLAAEELAKQQQQQQQEQEQEQQCTKSELKAADSAGQQDKVAAALSTAATPDLKRLAIEEAKKARAQKQEEARAKAKADAAAKVAAKKKAEKEAAAEQERARREREVREEAELAAQAKRELEAEGLLPSGCADGAAGVQLRARAVCEFMPESEDDLGLSVGDVVMVIDSSDADWWRGFDEGRPERAGTFPASFVETLNGDSIAAPAGEGDANGSAEAVRAVVQFDYEAEDESNVSLRVGDVMMVTDQSDSDWWRGYSEGEEDKEGYFPASFVDLDPCDDV
jgi:hypothetical protein